MIRKYTKKDYQMIASWYKERGGVPPRRETLSDLGFIVDNRVAGWLYLTNSNVAFIDCVISNPTTVPSLRRQSLKVLCGHLVDSALLLGYSTIYGFSNHPSIKQICRDMGFNEEHYSLFMLNESDIVIEEEDA